MFAGELGGEHRLRDTAGVDQPIGCRELFLTLRKNGRRSAKYTAARGSSEYCVASASTWEKSGFAVPESVRLLVTPQRALPPISGRSVE